MGTETEMLVMEESNRTGNGAHCQLLKEEGERVLRLSSFLRETQARSFLGAAQPSALRESDGLTGSVGIVGRSLVMYTQ